MTDSERLDWLEKTLRKDGGVVDFHRHRGQAALGEKPTFAVFTGPSQHVTLPEKTTIRQLIDAAIQRAKDIKKAGGFRKWADG